MIYKLDHFYALNHAEWCLILECNKTTEEMINITSAIEFLFEDIVAEDLLLDKMCLLKILCNYYECKDVKEKYDKYIPLMKINDSEWKTVNEFVFQPDNICITQIDLYEGRESCCGSKYPLIMETYLPKGEIMDELKNLLIKEGQEH